MSLLRICAVAVSWVVGSQALAQADVFRLEGLYSISERGICADDHIDSLVLFADAEGNLVGHFTSARYDIVYQVHDLTWDGGGEISGSTIPRSRDDATFTAVVSADGQDIEGTVNAVSCSVPWEFKAHRRAAFASDFLAPVQGIVSVDYFVGNYAARSNTLEGDLRFIRLADGRVVGNFGNATVRRLIGFDRMRLAADANVLELFSYDVGNVQIKWRLRYGLRDGRLTLEGYGLNATGRYYPVRAVR